MVLSVCLPGLLAVDYNVVMRTASRAVCRRSLPALGLCAVLFGEGCASQKEQVWLRESERSQVLTSSDEAMKREIEELSVWMRERKLHEAGWFEEARR